MNRLASIDYKEIEKALKSFIEKPVLLGVTGHDFRNLATEVDFVRSLISEQVKNFLKSNLDIVR